MKFTTHEIDLESLVWRFTGDGPSVYIGQMYGTGTPHRVDPFPGYAHDMALVEDTIGIVRRAWDLPDDVSLLIATMPYEEVGRTNGWTQHDWKYYGDDGEPLGENRLYIPSIGLSGKRIPPHPAMTRYLVAHEYGHVACGWIAAREGAKAGSTSEIEKEYRRIRELPSDRMYGGRTWHEDAGEVMANDFRILICNIEPEFWPHPGIDRPDGPLEFVLRDWWEQHR